ncbi:molybdopterin-dependent oxidoreductase [Cryptosporangium sp. NPDC051539]|uniref:molybdopterin-dependent oxidoreductase n=1 Tax=Cryptosporangium sp. NPDC051539 TaxID=3363962 RepID=UPI0037A37B3C
MPEPTTHRVACQMCSAFCGVEITVSGNRVVSAKGDKNHPLSGGYLCPKGHSYPHQHHREDRLSFPRIGGRTVSWTECLDDIAATLRRLVDRRGPDQVGSYLGTGGIMEGLTRTFTSKLLRAIGSRQVYSALTVDHAPLLRAAELVTGHAMVLPQWNPESPDEPTLAILIGHNPVVSHGYLNTSMFTNPTRRIRAFRDRGGEVWVLDPRRTETAGRADRHLALRPGTDAALLAWLVREVLAEGADPHELDTACTDDDLWRLREAVEPFELGSVAALTDVAEADLLDLLRAVRSHRRLSVASGTGVSFGRHSVVTEWLKWVLLIITGSLDTPGGMRFLLSMPLSGLGSPAPVNGSVQPGPASRPDLDAVFGEQPAVALVHEIEAGNLGGLIIAGGQPPTAFPDPARLRRAFDQLELCVVIDAFENDLTRRATHVLPATWHLERHDLFFYGRRISSPAALAPEDGRRPTWWMCTQIARRLGHDLLGGALDADECTEEELYRYVYAGRDDLDEVLAAGSHGVETPRPPGWVHDHVLPGGRWRLVPPLMVERLPAVWERDTSSWRLLPARRLRNNNSVEYGAAPSGPPPVLINPEDARRLGLDDGRRVRVSTERGHVDGVVEVDGRLRRGVVVVSHGYLDQNVGVLTNGTDVDPLTGQPEQTDVRVSLTRLD